MKIIEDAVRYPVSTAVGVILLVLFGAIGLTQLPIQLTPEVSRPQITISTIWPGASPLEVERDIVDEQEEQLKSVEGMLKMRSNSSDSFGSITLTFAAGTNLDTALIKVSNALEQVPTYPSTVEKPILTTRNADAHAMAWLILRPLPENGFDGDISTLFNFADDFIKPAFERVPGVAASNIYGGREREMQVIVDPARLAIHQVTLNELGAALERENRNYSGGDFDEGKRRYVVRTVGEYASPDDLEQVVIAVRNGVPVYLKDVARAELGYRRYSSRIFHLDQPVLALNAIPQSGANVMDAMRDLQETITALQTTVLSPRGLELFQVYDQTEYIDSSIGLVRQSLAVGGILAIIILLLFLRSASSTLVVGVSIPVSLIGTFLVMWIFGRTINVVSLAGMAFAVGMVVDNSIVVLENIYRHRQMGKSSRVAAIEGSSQVWGAVLASTLTTMAVFIPVAFIKEEAGQLFGDIAIAIAASVGLSLLVSITVIPSLSARILRAASADSGRRGFHDLWGGAARVAGVARGISGMVHWITGSTARRLTITIGLAGISIGLAVWLMPATDYLPQGNQNFLFGGMSPPPGYNIDEVAEIRKIYEADLEGQWQHPAGSPEALALPGGGIKDFFFGAVNNGAFMGVSANDPMRVRELLDPFVAVNRKIPGVYAAIQQASIFRSDFGDGRRIDIELTGPDLDHLIVLGQEVFGQVGQLMPKAQAQPVPGLNLGNPEVQVKIHRRRAAELGVTNRDLGFAVRALVDGAKASDYQHEGRELDLMVKAEEGFGHRTHLLEQLPIATPDGRLVTLGSIASIRRANGPVAVLHSERERTITIQVTPEVTAPLQEAMETINASILGPMRAAGKLGGLYRARLSGTADKLEQTGRAMGWVFLLVLIITYLLMASLFESFLYPFVIMFSVPLAALGGFIGLALINQFTPQPLDVITMLGFIILVGTVVNNAILIVHQSLNYMRDEGMAPRDAIREATASRVRPIFMTVGTSTFGMLPLVLFPGAGSELYRGLGSVVVGGLIISTLFTLFLVPAVFSLTLDIRSALAARLRARFGFADRTATGESAGG